MRTSPPGFGDILAARRRLHGLALRTPLIEQPVLSAQADGRVLLKLENLQRTGSFKFRGAYNKIAQIDRAAFPGGVVTCSSGNHAQGVAAAARVLGLQATIVMPADAPRAKITRTKALGAEIVFCDRVKDDREAIARDLCSARTAAFIPPFDDADIIAGQGTVGLEIAEQAEAIGAQPETVLVPTSGGGLVAGIALAITGKRPQTALFSVEPVGFDDFARSLAAGRRERNTALAGSLCDALLVPSPGELTFEVARRTLAGGLTVTDEEAKAAVRFAFHHLKLVLEPGGAVALAAVLARKVPLEGRTAVVVLSGGNIDPGLFAAIIAE
jgi:threonine dehydratase